MFKREKQLTYWSQALESGQKACEVAQQELHRLLGEEALANVIFVDFTSEEPDEVA
jgi:hypothetical protein